MSRSRHRLCHTQILHRFCHVCGRLCHTRLGRHLHAPPLVSCAFSSCQGLVPGIGCLQVGPCLPSPRAISACRQLHRPPGLSLYVPRSDLDHRSRSRSRLCHTQAQIRAQPHLRSGSYWRDSGLSCHWTGGVYSIRFTRIRDSFCLCCSVLAQELSQITVVLCTVGTIAHWRLSKHWLPSSRSLILALQARAGRPTGIWGKG